MVEHPSTEGGGRKHTEYVSAFMLSISMSALLAACVVRQFPLVWKLPQGRGAVSLTSSSHRKLSINRAIECLGETWAHQLGAWCDSSKLRRVLEMQASRKGSILEFLKVHSFP